MNFNDLKYIAEIDKYSSISLAAKNLYVAQSNLSRAVKRIEEEYKIVIFERTPKGVITTREGQSFIEHAKEVLYQVTIMKKNYFDLIDLGVRVKISVPRASYISEAFTEYMNSLKKRRQITYPLL